MITSTIPISPFGSRETVENRKAARQEAIRLSRAPIAGLLEAMPALPGPPSAAQKAAAARSPTPADVLVSHGLHEQRKRAGLSQPQLASLLGISFQQVQRYENGENRVSASRLYQISRVLGVPMSSFFERFSAVTRQASAHAGYDIASVDHHPEIMRFIQVVRRITDEKKRRRLRDMVAVLAEARIR